MRLLPVLLVSILLVEYAGAQSSIVASRQRGGPPAPARGGSPAPARGGAGSSGGVYANLGQLMKGILYPNSNVIFAAQTQNPAQVKPASDPATATDPLASTYGKWEAVENSALALSEAAGLLMVPGRRCANGRPVPLQNPDWPKLNLRGRYVQKLRFLIHESAALSRSNNAPGLMNRGLVQIRRRLRAAPVRAERQEGRRGTGQLQVSRTREEGGA